MVRSEFMNSKKFGLTDDETRSLAECYEHLDEDQLAELEAEAHEIVLSEISASQAAEVAFPLLLKSMMHQRLWKQRENEKLDRR